MTKKSKKEVCIPTRNILLRDLAERLSDKATKFIEEDFDNSGVFTLDTINFNDWSIEFKVDNGNQIDRWFMLILHNRVQHCIDFPDSDDDTIHMVLSHMNYCTSCEIFLTSKNVCNDCFQKFGSRIMEIGKCDICTKKSLNGHIFTPKCCKTSENPKHICSRCLRKLKVCPFCKDDEKFRESMSEYLNSFH